MVGGGGGCEESCRVGFGYEEGINVEGVYFRVLCVFVLGFSDFVCKMEIIVFSLVLKEGFVL